MVTVARVTSGVWGEPQSTTGALEDVGNDPYRGPTVELLCGLPMVSHCPRGNYTIGIILYACLDVWAVVDQFIQLFLTPGTATSVEVVIEASTRTTMWYRIYALRVDLAR